MPAIKKNTNIIFVKNEVIGKREIQTFFYYTKNVQKYRKKKNSEIHAHITSYHTYSVKIRVTGVSKTT